MKHNEVLKIQIISAAHKLSALFISTTKFLSSIKGKSQCVKNSHPLCFLYINLKLSTRQYQHDLKLDTFVKRLPFRKSLLIDRFLFQTFVERYTITLHKR